MNLHNVLAMRQAARTAKAAQVRVAANTRYASVWALEAHMVETAKRQQSYRSIASTWTPAEKLTAVERYVDAMKRDAAAARVFLALDVRCWDARPPFTRENAIGILTNHGKLPHLVSC